MSDYISREAVTNELEKHKYSRDYCVLHNIDWAIDFGVAMASVDSIPSAFEGMTNGEIIKALFPNVSKYNNMLLENHSRNILFDDNWWNAPYKKGGE